MERADRRDHLERYSEHARRLQTWIGAYGGGLAALLIYHYPASKEAHVARVKSWFTDKPDILADRLPKELGAMSDDLFFALICIVLALGLQVILVLFNKTTQLVLANRPVHSDAYKRADRWSEKFWVDFSLDILSVTLLIAATVTGVIALRLFWV